MAKLDFKQRFSNPRLAAIVGLVVIVGALLVWKIFAASANISAVPSTTDVKPGDNFSVDVVLNTAGAGVNAVEAHVTYPTDKLDLQGLDSSSSAFGQDFSPAATTSPIVIVKGLKVTPGQPAEPPVSGSNVEVVKINFHVKDTAVGQIGIGFTTGTRALDPSNGSTDILNGNFNAATINITQPLQPPGTPGNLRSTNASPNSVSLAWDAPTSGGPAENYVVTRLNDNHQFAAVTGTTMTDTGLQPSTQYQYQVSAHNAAGDSAQSNTVTVATLPVPVQPPSAPVNLIVSGHTSNSLTISWGAPTGGGAVANYVVSLSGPTSASATLDSATTTYQFTNLVASSAYTMSVRAQNSAGGNLATVSGSTDATTGHTPVATMFLSPAATTVAAGGTVTFDVRIDTGGDSLNAVQATINYPTDQFVNPTVDESGSDFAAQIAAPSITPGQIQLFRGAALGGGAVTGSGKLVARISLTTASNANGTYGINFNNAASRAISSVDNMDTLYSTTGSNVVIYQPQTGGGGGGNNGGGGGYTPPPGNPTTPSPIIKYTNSPSPETGDNSTPTGTTSTPAPTDNTVTVTTLPSSEAPQVTVSVTDANGKPVSGAQVQIDGATATTNALGEAVFKGLKPGKYTVTITSNGKTQTSQITVESAGSKPTQTFKVKVGTTTGVGNLPLALLALIIIALVVGLGYVLYRMGFFTRFKPRGELASGAGKHINSSSGTVFVPQKGGGAKKSDTTSVNTKVYYPQKDKDGKK